MDGQIQNTSLGIEAPRFSKNSNTDFSKQLRKRVNAYFKTNNIGKHANKSMVFKTMVMLAIFFIPLIFINSGLISTTSLLFFLYFISGIGMAGIGMGIMYDALHGSYSKNQKVNRFLGYSMNLIGGSAAIWRIQHNVLHHTYTNIEGADDDLNTPSILRFSPQSKKRSVHRFQHLYVWFFYCLSTVSWITTKDFIRLNRYRKMGFFDKTHNYRSTLLEIIGWKLVYFSYALVLPLLIIPLNPWIIVVAFLSMHFTTGLLISIVFQVAHIMPDIEFPLPDKNGIITRDWTAHQLSTTSNFSPKSRIFSWLIGGLNFQIEHHLLPHICHIHYRKISGIVAETAREYGLPYNSKKTFIKAIADHVGVLKTLGQKDPDNAN